MFYKKIECRHILLAHVLLFFAALFLCPSFIHGQEQFKKLSSLDRDLMRAAMTGPTRETTAWVVNEKTRNIDEVPEPAFPYTVADLLDKGANINARDPDGTTPLMTAIEFNNTLGIHTLIDRGADLNLKGGYGRTALMFACQMGYLNFEIVKKLVHKGADVNEKDDQEITPLMFAVTFEKEEVLRFLIKNGADINASTQEGWTALSLAKTNNITRMVEVLKSLGAED